MIRKLIIPDGWPCVLAECPPGPFIPVSAPDQLCFKTEYGQKESFNAGGEYYHHDSGLVQPVVMQITEEDV